MKSISANFRSLALGFVSALLLAASANAAEVRVMISGGLTAAHKALVPEFERATGHKVIVSFEAGPSLMQKVTSNAPADLVTQTPEVIDELIRKGKVAAGAKVVFARAGIGVAARHDFADRGGRNFPGLVLHGIGNTEFLEHFGRDIDAAGRVGIGDRFRGQQRALHPVGRTDVRLRRPRFHRDADR